jgi:hypothetical protein
MRSLDYLSLLEFGTSHKDGQIRRLLLNIHRLTIKCTRRKNRAGDLHVSNQN